MTEGVISRVVGADVDGEVSSRSFESMSGMEDAIISALACAEHSGYNLHARWREEEGGILRGFEAARKMKVRMTVK